MLTYTSNDWNVNFCIASIPQRIEPIQENIIVKFKYSIFCLILQTIKIEVLMAMSVSSLPLHGATTPAHVRPTTVRKTNPAAIELAKKKKYLNSDLVKKFLR